MPLEPILTEILAGGILPSGSYLAGGTAVYFRLRRRLSVDLEIFTPVSFQAETFAFRIRELVSPADIELMEKDTLAMCSTEPAMSLMTLSGLSGKNTALTNTTTTT